MALMFPRLARNFARNGYFPTDEPTLERTLSALCPADGPMAILDPCAGEGVALAEAHESALAKAVDLSGTRVAEGTPLNVTIVHAEAHARAEQVEGMMRERWKVARLFITPLSMTIGSQVGPGAIGIGVAPAVEG